MKFAVAFDSPSEQGGYIPAVLNALQQVGDASTITSQDIMDGALASYHAVVFPGGLASFIGLKKWGDEFANAVRYFISAGGGYLGVCGGAYIAGRAPANAFRAYCNLTLGLADVKVETPPIITSIDSYRESQWHRYPVSVTFASEDHPIISGHLGETLDIVYSSGAVIDEPGATVDVLANFAEEGFGGKIALIATYFGQGRVVLCSPHPEATFVGETEACVPWLYPAMATWVAEREIEVIYPVSPWRKTLITSAVPLAIPLAGFLGIVVGGAIGRRSQKGV
jgi:putative intracellular protease/amidase